MAGLKTSGVAPLDYLELRSNDNEIRNDGTIILQNIEVFRS